MVAKATTTDAYNLLHEGAAALVDVEQNGIRIDLDRVERNIEKTRRRMKKMLRTMQQDEVWQVWKKTYGRDANLGSRDQLGVVLFDKMGFKCLSRTTGGRPKADEEALSKLNLPFVKRYLKLEQLQKVRNTYLRGIQRETVDGLLHPVFSLHLVRTYRGSSDSPNFQNIPVRTLWMSELIRTCFISRPNHQLIELDYSGLEVRVSACNHKDPQMIKYVNDPTTDMHRDMACELYMIEPDEVSEMARYSAKNRFVFPEFYGDYYVACAKGMWDSINEFKLVMPDGTGLREHLTAHGIERLGRCDPKEKPRPGTYEKHVFDIENKFWNERFEVYGEWKEKRWKHYCKTGRFDLLTGFIIEGLYSRNDVSNYPIQGPAFHCLLWSLIRLNRWLKRNKMQTKLVGQIHDSIVADVHKDEKDDYLYMANKIMTERIRKAWPWIIVPLEVKAEVAPEDGSWFDKKEVELVA